VRRRQEEAEKNEASNRTRGGGEEGRGDDSDAEAASCGLSRGGGGTGRRERDALEFAIAEDESLDEPLSGARGERRRDDGCRRGVRGRGRGRGRGRSAVLVGLARCKRTRTAPAASGSYSSSSYSTSSLRRAPHNQALDKTWPQTSPYDDDYNDEIYTMADYHLQVPLPALAAPWQAPMPRHLPPSIIVEEAATDAATMIAAAAATWQSDGSDEGLGGDARARTEKDLKEEDVGSAGHARGGRALGSLGRRVTASAALHSNGTDADGADVDGACVADPGAHEEDLGGRTRRGRVSTSGRRSPVAPHHVRSALRARTSALMAARAATSSFDEDDETNVA